MSMADELIDVAERALRAFGGDPSREQAAVLLTMWRYGTDLTPADRTAVLARFRSVDERVSAR
jgi:hypothetical protein